MVRKTGHPALLAFAAQRSAVRDDGGIPYLTVCDLTFPDYGKVTVTREDLGTVKRLFDDHIRGVAGNLPIIDEEHDGYRAAGRITRLDFDSTNPELLVAYPEWNAGHETLATDGSYLSTSPTLLRDWVDPKTGVNYPIAPAGLRLHGEDDTSALALTNFPRIRDLGPIAASEGGAVVVPFAEGALSAAMPGDVMTSLTTDKDGDALVPCSWAPPFANYNRCPGYTRVLVDGDDDEPGDKPGCCKLATLCNGYSPVQPGDGNNNRYDYAEDGRMSPRPGANPSQTGDPAEGTMPSPVPTQDAGAATSRADLAETNKMLAAERRQREQLQVRVQELGEQIAARDAQDKIRGVSSRLEACVNSGRLTPGERDLYLAEAKTLVLMAENDAFLRAIEAREPVVRMGESENRVHGEPLEGADESNALIRAAEEVIAEAQKSGKALPFHEAAAEVARRQNAAAQRGARR